VGEVQDLKVLNLSELVIALRAEVLPGDALQIKIVREGREAEQGVGYLEDGTMVVVEEARQRIGERLAVTVTGALQTPTGRMVFARAEKAEAAEKQDREKAERSEEKGGAKRSERSGERPGGRSGR
jgi:uncharacterized protein YacL